MKLTAQDLLEFQVIDKIIKEPKGGAQTDVKKMSDLIKKEIISSYLELKDLDKNTLVASRYEKFRNMGKYINKN